MMRLLVSLWLVFATLMSASATKMTADNDKHQQRRDLLLRGARRDKENSQGERELSSWWYLADYLAYYADYLSYYMTGEYTNTMKLYTMDTSLPTSENSMYASSLAEVQPFYKVNKNGAEGTLVYKPHGWEFSYALAAQGLPRNTEYELVMHYPSSNSEFMPDMMCMGSAYTTPMGMLFMVGSVPVEASMDRPSQGEQGAKVWLALSSDVDCSGAQAQMVQNSVPNYGKYMFPPASGYLDFEYIGD